MQLGMVGLGRMGANMVRRLIQHGHNCVVFDKAPEAVSQLVREKAVGAASLTDLAKNLAKPRVIWLMVPAAVVDETITDLLPKLDAGDILIDGGNSYYVDDIRRAKQLAPKRIHYVDVGTSGVWGLARGYCMMIGGAGSELILAVEAHEKLLAEGIRSRVVSMPSWEIFEHQTEEYRNSVLPPDVSPRVAVEQASTFGWERYVGPQGASSA
jgi:6-phosphogluconate dehydrogenase